MPSCGRDSQWKDTATIDLEKARELAARLEMRGTAQDEIDARNAYLDLLGVKPGDCVLDVGCGSGVVTRAIGERVGPGGRVIGVDPSAALLTVARENADRSAVGARIEFREAGALSLPFDDASFDAVVAVTVLAHMHGGADAVPELVRVAKPGGRVGVFDFDADMTLFTHPDRELTRRIVSAAADAVAVDGWIARRLPTLFRDSGLEGVRARAFFPLDSDPDGFYVTYGPRSASAAVKVGAITEAEAKSWVDAYHAQLETGVVLAGRLHLFVWGRRPA